MTGNSKEREALDRLTDALVEDILSASDKDVLAEGAEGGDDPAKIAADMRALFELTVLEAGKANLARAKKAADEARHSGTVVNITEQMRHRYNAIVANDTDLAAKLTMAARKGEGQSQQDIDSAIEDLNELGALDDAENGDP